MHRPPAHGDGRSLPAALVVPLARGLAGAAFLDGTWLRAPCLHNGSVPTLHDLLAPPARRPTEFRRGHDVYDPVKVAVVTASASAPATRSARRAAATRATPSTPSGRPRTRRRSSRT